MKFKPYYITSEQLDSLPIAAGQFIVCSDTQTIYFDESDNSRIDISSGVDVISNGIYWNDDSTIEDLVPYSKTEIDNKINDIVAAMTIL